MMKSALKRPYLFALSIVAVLLAGCTPSPQANEKTETVPTAPADVPAESTSEAIPTDMSEWILKNANIVFTSTKTDKKGNDILETGTFKGYTGLLDKQGDFKLTVDLRSVVTEIVIRDQRISDWLFESDKFSQAVISGHLDAKEINALGLNQSLSLVQPIALELHGNTMNIDTKLNIVRTSAKTISVQTTEPIMLNVDQLGMSDGLQRLADVMKLAGIKADVPVSFVGEFGRP